MSRLVGFLSALATLAALAVFFAGCTLVEPGSPLSLHQKPEYLTVKLQPARNMYATLRQMVRARATYVLGKCDRAELSVPECAQIAKDIESIRQLDFEITRALDNPTAELDVEKITRLLEIAAKIIGAFVP